MSFAKTPRNADLPFPEEWELPDWTLGELLPRRCGYVLLIPVLNEGERIRKQLRALKPYARRDVDIVIVDGGSDDGALDSNFLLDQDVRALLVKTGAGRLGAQLRVGLAWAMSQHYRGVVLMDGNGKDDPDAIPEFVRALQSGADHVQGSRYVEGGVAENTPLIRDVAIRWIHAPLLSLASHFRYTDTTNGFRAYSRHFLLDPRVQPFRNVFDGYQLHYYLARRAGRLRFDVREIPVKRRYPDGRVPTKIKGARGYLEILGDLVSVCLGKYDPVDQQVIG